MRIRETNVLKMSLFMRFWWRKVMEKKSITNAAKLILQIWNIGTFAAVWFLFYNKYMFDTYQQFGGLITMLLYMLAYNAFCSVYKAFRFASSPISETVFSQLISFGASDLILYVQCCLIYNRYVNIWPGVLAVIVQIIGTACITIGAKKYIVKTIPPKRTTLVFGKDKTREQAVIFAERILAKYEHLFTIEHVSSENEELAELEKLVLESDNVLLFEVSSLVRVRLLDLCLQKGKSIYFTPSLDDIMLQGCTPKHLLDTPLMKYDYGYQKGYYTKRLWDILISLFILILTAPILILTAIAIKLEDGGPVFFKQERCTKDAKVFKILKFRSMIVNAEKDGVTPCTANDSRITKVGKLIRATRIDELPQLINILKGDMSFVGPRPERIEHVEQYCKELPEFAYRMRVKGGLTGYAQIFGKYNTSAYDKLRLDMMYIENQSLLLDLKIVMLTFRTIFTPESTEGFTEEKSGEMKKVTAEAKNAQAE